MGRLFSEPTFEGFGPNYLEACAQPLVQLIHARGANGLRMRVKQQCPREPGVYGMLDATERLIYVGKAKCLRTRLLSYFRPASRNPKAGRILGNSRVIVWEPADSEFAALLRELDLICRLRPPFNVQGQPGRRSRAYVCLGRRPAPYVYLTSRVPCGSEMSFGPVPSGRRARDAVRCVNDWFRLRDCPQTQPMVFAEETDLFPVARAPGCLRYDIGTCLGPCAALCSGSTYEERVSQASAFLRGRDRMLVRMLEQQMNAAASALEYERAARLRDDLEALRWLQGWLERLRGARQQSGIYPVTGRKGQGRWYLIRGGRVVASVAAPHDSYTGTAALAVLDRVYGQTFCDSRLTANEETEAILLLTRWFQRYPQERAKIIVPQTALRVCRRLSGGSQGQGSG